jgi:hypothetical protein
MLCDCGYRFSGEETESEVSSSKGSNRKKAIKFPIIWLGLIWISINHISIFPIGGIISMIHLFKQSSEERKTQWYIYCGCIVCGFLGTGIAIDFSKSMLRNDVVGYTFSPTVQIGVNNLLRILHLQ